MSEGTTALILVDIQHDFMPDGALPVPEGDAVVPVANRLMRGSGGGGGYGLVVASQDWHPADHGSFASQHDGKQPGDEIELHGLSQTLWPDHCVQGTPGAALHSALELDRLDLLVRKGSDPAVDSYSASFDNGRRHDTGLADRLRAHGVTAVDLVGLATNVCVLATALDAADLGFDTRVLAEGVRGVDLQPGDVDAAWQKMREAGVKVG